VVNRIPDNQVFSFSSLRLVKTMADRRPACLKVEELALQYQFKSVSSHCNNNNNTVNTLIQEFVLIFKWLVVRRDFG
jgi:hypothetical protein